jgi:hypothetical protein
MWNNRKTSSFKIWLLTFQRCGAVNPESVATLPPFSPIEGQKWFDQISSQWESQKNRFALTYFGKIQFLPPCIWILPFMSTASVEQSQNILWSDFNLCSPSASFITLKKVQMNKFFLQK